ncbi:hypothetical protein HELRODRAFT_162665 [Helobdella robusta]|uniref:Uncharacterized protein n=1 Tax=Helobdella robusta TaxID=6412 RepID=T1ESZ5_HELRO|nr:hypothetical protein HELRODRAFT_162665 [Helobdella robusta]ESN99170.1 hypothetical protein HELRODRAFT_162665 [Helobdella robusta]
MYAENRIGRSEYSNEIFVTLPAIKVYSPSRVDFSADDRCITIILPSFLYSTTVSPTTSSPGPDDNISNVWGNFCASVDVFDGTSWITEYPCIKERKIDLSGSKIKKITQVRVSICSDERHDICSEQKYNSDNGVNVKELKTITQTVHLNENGTLPGKPSNGYISYTLSSNRNNSSKNIFKVDNKMKFQALKFENLEQAHVKLCKTYEWKLHGEDDQQHDWNGSVCMASVHNCNNHDHNCNNHDHNYNSHDHYGNNNSNNINLDNYSFDNGDFLVGSTFVDTCEASRAPPPTFQSPSIIWHPQQQHPHNHQALPYSAQSPYISEDEHTSTMELIHKPSFPITHMTDGSSSTQGTIKSFNLVNRSSTDVNKQAKIIHEVIV